MQSERFGAAFIFGFILTVIVFTCFFVGFALIGFVVFIIQVPGGVQGDMAAMDAVARAFIYIAFIPAVFGHLLSPAATIIIGKRIKVGRLSVIYASIVLWTCILAFVTAIKFSFGPFPFLPIPVVMFLALLGLGGATVAYVVIWIISRKKSQSN